MTDIKTYLTNTENLESLSEQPQSELSPEAAEALSAKLDQKLVQQQLQQQLDAQDPAAMQNALETAPTSEDQKTEMLNELAVAPETYPQESNAPQAGPASAPLQPSNALNDTKSVLDQQTAAITDLLNHVQNGPGTADDKLNDVQDALQKLLGQQARSAYK